MFLSSVFSILLSCLAYLAFSQRIEGRLNTGPKLEKVIWCTGGNAEYSKCLRFSQSVKRIPEFQVSLECKKEPDRDKCMTVLDNGEANLLTLDPGEVFVAGRYHSLVPIMAERYGPSKDDGYYSVVVIHGSLDIRDLYSLRDKKACFPGVGQYAGWVLPLATLINERILNITDCNNLVKSTADFFGPSCAPGSLIDKYNPSGDNPQKMCELCAGSKGDRCSGNDPYAQFDGAFRCLSEGGGQVAFLKHTTVQEMTSKAWYRGPPRYDFRLLCPSGVTASIDEYYRCNWGYAPANAVVTLSAALPEQRQLYQNFLQKAVDYFGSMDSTYNSRGWNRSDSGNSWSPTTPFPWDTFNNRNRTDSFNSSWNNWNDNSSYSFDNNTRGRQFDDRNRGSDQFDDRSRSRSNFNNRQNPWESSTTYGPYDRNRFGYNNQNYGNASNVGGFLLFDSSIYGPSSNLLFQDSCTGLVPVPESQQTFKGYLGSRSAVILGLRKCPVSPARLCVVSDKEYEKCIRMKTAFKAQMLKPDLSCVKASSQMRCMALVNDNAADLVVLDAGDIYKAGQHYGLESIISEQYDLDDSRYFAVAVTVQPDKTTDLLYLKGKRSCHSGIGTGAGWVIPMSFLISSERMRSYGCNSVRAASEFFQKSCVPGALSREYSFGRWGYDNLCDLCHGSSNHYCSREAGEPFYGDSGALRCLVEGGGEIAFVRHTTILQNAAGRNPSWWSRPMMPEDFELLCRDGTRAKHNDFRTCNLGSVASNALVASAYKEPSIISAYINLFMYAQQFYGSKYSEDFTFKMFVSEGGFHDLIFQDATQQLKVVPQEKRNYRNYLGAEFLRSVRMTDCTAGALSFSSVAPIILVIVCLQIQLIL